jgi:hypothetical protein
MDTYARLSIAEVCEEVGLLDISQGLSDIDVKARVRSDGPNRLPQSEHDRTSSGENKCTLIYASLMIVLAVYLDSSVMFWSSLLGLTALVCLALCGRFNARFTGGKETRPVSVIRNGAVRAVNPELLE